MDTSQTDKPGWSGSDNDLPLMSNTADILIRHFILDLECSMTEKTMSGSLTLFLDPAKTDSTAHVFSLQEFQTVMTQKLEKAKHQNSTNSDLLKTQEQNHEIEMKISNNTGSYSGCHDNEKSVLSKSQKAMKFGDVIPQRSNINLDISNQTTHARKPFELVLDCCDVEVTRVESMESTKSKTEWMELYAKDLNNSEEEYLKLSKEFFSKELSYKSDKWSVKIWDNEIFDAEEFPKCVRIHYKTLARGASLRWAIDQDGEDCVYTAGMWVNNRSLLPCQEYGSLSTWQANIRVESENLSVLMSGDEEARITKEHDLICHYYKSRMPLPSFALALAIGSWDCEVVSYQGFETDGSVLPETVGNHVSCSKIDTVFPTEHEDLVGTCDDVNTTGNKHDDGKCEECSNKTITQKTDVKVPYLTETCVHDPECFIPYNDKPTLPCRIFAPKSLLPRAIAEFKRAIPQYSKAVQQLLGPCPFPRIDIMIYPPCSQDMAMSNPNLLFLSQSVLSGDGSMCIRLGHEISHFWFGLLLGARDWTEEWLSEGFATFVEDIIEATVRGWTDAEREEHSELAAYLRYKTLAAELEHTSSELQTLRPNKGEGLEKSRTEPGSVMFIKNGMNPNKLFTQVHYLKGYFLLRWASCTVGYDGMRTLLREYIVKHHGQMVTSKDFLNLALKCFPQLSRDHTIDGICQDWLDCAGIPAKLQSFQPSGSNSLYRTVLQQFSMWEMLDRSLKRVKSHAKRRKIQCDFATLDAQQLLLLLDKLLTKSSLCNTTISRLCLQYSFTKRNTEINHRWFELAIKHKYKPAYADLGRYLVDHQAMGVYLYGEMIISRCPKLKSVALSSFQEVYSQMEATTADIVHKMLYGA